MLSYFKRSAIIDARRFYILVPRCFRVFQLRNPTLCKIFKVHNLFIQSAQTELSLYMDRVACLRKYEVYSQAFGEKGLNYMLNGACGLK